MRTIFLFCLLALSMTGYTQEEIVYNATPQPGESFEPFSTPVVNKEKTAPFAAPAMQLPAFPGGAAALQTFFAEQLSYPEIAERNGIEGTVLVKFKVTEEGRPDQIAILEGLGFGCDEAVIQLIGTMPDWQPAQQGRLACKATVVVPVDFRLK